MTNRAVFLANFTADGVTDHVERPTSPALPGGAFLVLYEHWTHIDGDAFDGT